MTPCLDMLKEAVDRSLIELAPLSSPENRDFPTVSTVSNASTVSTVSTASTVSTVTTSAAARKRFEQLLRQKGRDLVTTSRAVTKSICQLNNSLKDQQEIVFYVRVRWNSNELVVSSILLSTVIGTNHQKNRGKLPFGHSSIRQSGSKHEALDNERYSRPSFVSMQRTHFIPSTLITSIKASFHPSTNFAKCSLTVPKSRRPSFSSARGSECFRIFAISSIPRSLDRIPWSSTGFGVGNRGEGE